MEQTRIQKYEELEAKIGNTPLIKYVGEVPNGNILKVLNVRTFRTLVYTKIFDFLFENQGFLVYNFDKERM